MDDQWYTYEPLDSSSDEIRLILIYPPTYPGSPILLNIAHAKLSDAPKYEALSYMWGLEEDPQHVIIQGKRLGVGRNLWLALQRLRLLLEMRVLWVDAICINQQNTSDRNHQVSQMSKIYRQAWRVAVWLGPETEDSGSAFEFFRSHADSSILEMHLSRASNRWESVHRLYENPYWCRLWIIQETVLAQDLTLYCGKDELEWTSFVKVMSWAKNTPITITPIEIIEQRTTQDIEKLLSKFKNRSLPRLAGGFPKQYVGNPEIGSLDLWHYRLIVVRLTHLSITQLEDCNSAKAC